MNKPRTLEKIEKLYTNNIINHGISSKAVGWNTEESQNTRFDKLNSVIENPSKPFSINDYGCGYGSHFTYLVNSGFNVNKYYGYDISTDMLNSAEGELIRFKEKVQLLNSDKINTVADYSFVSGTFNVRFKEKDELWKEYIIEKLVELNKYSRQGFSFNMLSSFVDWKEDHLYYGDPCFWFNLCKNKFSKKVNLIHDYELFEWTITVRI